MNKCQLVKLIFVSISHFSSYALSLISVNHCIYAQVSHYVQVELLVHVHSFSLSTNISGIGQDS